MSSLTAVTDDSFEADVIEATMPTLVDFWAPWCNPCLAVAPIVEELAIQLEGKVKVVKMDTEANPHTAPKFGIRGIPTFILFKDGQVVATQPGALSKAQLEKFVTDNL